jgi:hypothetical protein
MVLRGQRETRGRRVPMALRDPLARQAREEMRGHKGSPDRRAPRALRAPQVKRVHRHHLGQPAHRHVHRGLLRKLVRERQRLR